RVVYNVGLHAAAELAVTVITIEEQVSGWYRMLRKAKQPPQIAKAYQELMDTVLFFARWQILPYSVPAIARYDGLRSLKLNVRNDNLRIAAVPLEHGVILVTRTLRDFQRIPTLPVENWAV